MATESALRKSVAAWLNQYKGIKEGSAEHKAILAVFNDSKLCTRYTMTTSDAWCATAVSAAFIACGLSKIFPCIECSCARMVTLASTAKIWKEDDSYKPSIGDVILYDWQDSGSGDNTGTPDHVGIVQDVSGTTITVIEGNKSDTVGTRSIQVNGKYIRGYILPDYASVATADSSDTGSSALAVGDVVTYNGTTHYASANATTAKTCKGGQAKITQICKGAKHPYHLVHTGSGCTVYGWVDAADISGASGTSDSASASFAVGDKVKVTGTIYGNGNGTGGSIKKTAETMYVVNIVSSSKYTYYIGLAAKKGGTRQGWAKPSILTKL